MPRSRHDDKPPKGRRADATKRPSTAPGAKVRRPRPPRRASAKKVRTDKSGGGASEASGERLQRLLSRAGIASRRAAEDLIRAGRVTVNGRRASIGDRALPGDDVRVDGKEVQVVTEHATYLLYKPVGVVTTARDERGRRTVLDLVPHAPGLHPVGRLDRDSEGLLLLTNDGDLTLRLTHPRYGVDKEYRVWCKQGRVDGGALARLVKGIELDDGPAKALTARPAPGGAVLVLTEGRKREVRRMLKAVGYDVERLLRTRVGEFALGDLPVGAYREVGKDELERLGYTRPGRRP
ncbi:MAG: pseudouridine synthase [Trueperaceae bacterium]